MATDKTKRRVSYHFDESGILTVTVKEKQDGQIESFGIGANEARIDEEYLKLNPQLLKQMVLFGENLAKQLNISGVRLRSINFGTINYKNQSRS